MAKHPSTRRESPPAEPASSPPPEPVAEPTPEPVAEAAPAPAETAPMPTEPADMPIQISAAINHPPDIGGPIAVVDAEEPPPIEKSKFKIVLTIELAHDPEKGVSLTSDLKVDGSDHLVSRVTGNSGTFRDLGSQFAQRVGWTLSVPEVEPTELGWERQDGEAEG